MQYIMELAFSLELIWDLFVAFSVFVLSSTTLSALLPNSSSNKIIQIFLDLLNFAAGNFWRNKNQSDDEYKAEQHSKRVKKKYGCDEKFGGRPDL